MINKNVYLDIINLYKKVMYKAGRKVSQKVGKHHHVENYLANQQNLLLRQTRFFKNLILYKFLFKIFFTIFYLITQNNKTIF